MNQPLTTFTTKSGKKIDIVTPSMDMLDAILTFVNRLADEDTFLSFVPEHKITREDEKIWLDNLITKMKFKKAFMIYAIYNGKIVGSCDYNKGSTARDPHVASFGLMVDQDWRNDGIGRFILEYVINQAKADRLKIATLTVFSDNEIGKNLYEKVGFTECGRIPDGFIRKGQYSDCIRMCKRLD